MSKEKSPKQELSGENPKERREDKKFLNKLNIAYDQNIYPSESSKDSEMDKNKSLENFNKSITDEDVKFLKGAGIQDPRIKVKSGSAAKNNRSLEKDNEDLSKVIDPELKEGNIQLLEEFLFNRKEIILRKRQFDPQGMEPKTFIYGKFPKKDGNYENDLIFIDKNGDIARISFELSFLKEDLEIFAENLKNYLGFTLKNNDKLFGIASDYIKNNP